MRLNDDKLSAREHADVRDLVLAGAQRIKPVGAHRIQVLAGALAFVLIGGISAGAITTAALIGSGQPAPASTSTPTVTVTPNLIPTPTHTPLAPEPAASGVVAFDGNCANVLSEDEASASMGTPMIAFPAPWVTGDSALLGGIECRWIDATPGTVPSLYAAVYPKAAMTASFPVTDGVVCEVVDSVGRVCHVSGVAGASWYSIAAYPGSDDSASVAILAELVVERLDTYRPPTATPRGDAWWQLPACERLQTVDVAAALGVAGGLTPVASRWTMDAPWPIRLAVGRGSEYCEWIDGNGFHLTVRVVPGGGSALEAIAATETAQPVAVDGATAAVVVEDDDAWEGYYPVLVATDGVNLIAVQRSGMEPQEVTDAVEYAEVASALLAVLAR